MGKGKVHPSPSPAAAAAAGRETAEGVLLRLLPVAVLAMAAPLGPEAKEVLAYLVLASLRSYAPATPAREEPAAAHVPELGCGCFVCYTAYWSRWDGSPERDREAIHRAIEAFDEHLARKEEGEGSRRRRKKRASSSSTSSAAAAKGKAAEKGKASAAVEPPPTPPPPPVAVLPEQDKTSAAAPLLASAEAGEEAESTAAAGDVVPEERRRRVWGAVAGVLNWRSWGLWGSH